jgi:mono/diheme cytochrome c family protein
MRWKRATLIVIACGTTLAGSALAWMVSGPDAMDFAKGRTVPLADYRGASPTGVPPDFPSTDVIARGRYLAEAADCQACHTSQGGAPFSGSLPFHLPFGTIYSPNLTPDRETGIGGWTDAQFLRALREGVGPRAHLYPVMPYTSYTFMTDADALAIRAYLATFRPVRRQRPPVDFSFPFDRRELMKVWGALFNPNRRFEPNGDRSPAWNRGAYLAEGLGHCGDCHTPRNLLQAIDNRRKYAGAPIDGVRASNITSDPAYGLGGWSDADLAAFLSSGRAPGHRPAEGPMREVIDRSLSHLTRSDIAALVTYLRSIPPVTTPD